MSRVLLISDVSFSLHEVARALRLESCDVLEVLNEQDISAVVGVFRPDVAVLDFVAPAATIVALRAVRMADAYSAKIVVSAVADWEIVVQAMRSGACDWLRKPVSEADIVEAVRRVLAIHRTGLATAFEPAIEPHAYARLAEKAVRFIESPHDVTTLDEFGRVVGLSTGGIRNWCRTARIRARKFREFARALRAVVLQQAGSLKRAENILNFVDRRTLEKFLLASGGTRERLPQTVEEFLGRQQFIETAGILEAVRRALHRSAFGHRRTGDTQAARDRCADQSSITASH